jgi:hypothetical protein
MPICITGMHRSGTSMIARLLNICGLYLGEEKDLMNSQPDNPEGFWENIHFVDLNDKILSKLGGAWDLPPLIKTGWGKQLGFKTLYSKASELLHKFKGHESWGWKDPRNCLTTPFWNSLIRNLKFVICIRDPLEVAQSLQKRGGSSNAFGLNLWFIYNRQLLFNTKPQQRIITHFESYFIDPKEELKRVIDFLQLHISEQLINQACATINNSFRHHIINKSPIKISSKIDRLYEKLGAEAGTVYQKILAGEFTEVNNPRLSPDQRSDNQNYYDLKKIKPLVSDFELIIKEKDEHIQKLQAFIKNYDQTYSIDIVEFKKKLAAIELVNTVLSGIDVFSQQKDYTQIDGWAYIKNQSSENSKIAILFISEKRSYLFKTSPVKRPDVTSHFKALNYDDSGFYAVIPSIILEKGEYQLFIYIEKNAIHALQNTNKRLVIAD